VEDLEEVSLRTLVLVDRHKLRIVVDSDAAFALFQRLLVAGSTLERRETGGASLPPSAAAARDGQRGRSADEPAEQE
jgi:hypothetical protein